MPDSDHRSPVTIEDLLKLKRAERPAQEFWSAFERELRQKQLTALIEKRAWWQQWPQLVMRRAYLPAGITAIVAFTLVTVRQTAPVMITATESGAALAQVPVVAPQAAPRAPEPVAVPVSSPLVNRKDHAPLAIDDRVAVPARSQREYAAQTGPQSLMIGDPREELSPSARSIAANLARLQQSEPELVGVTMGNRLSAVAKPASETPAVAAEFASLPGGNTRRSRLLAQYNEKAVSPIVAAPEVVREKLARRLNDLDSGDRFTRVGLKGDQVSLKF